MIRLSFTITCLISIAACVPMQPQGQAQPQPQSGVSASSSTSGPERDEACRGACTVFDQCGKQPMDRCMAECDGVETERLERFASYSCEQLTAVLSGTVGSECASYGKDDCAPLGPSFGCCGGNLATRTPGQCIDMAVCNAPRY